MAALKSLPDNFNILFILKYTYIVFSYWIVIFLVLGMTVIFTAAETFRILWDPGSDSILF